MGEEFLIWGSPYNKGGGETLVSKDNSISESAVDKIKNVLL